MSRNHKNNHYHYAEKFEDLRKRDERNSNAFVPFKALIISLIVLMMFGFVCTTFSTYVTDNEPEYNPENPGLLAEVRNIKASRDIAVTGANADLAGSGGNITGGTVVVEVPSSWTSYSYIQFGLYQNGYLWCSADMTRIANTNFYYGSNPTDHGSWNNEQIMFMANNSHFGSGSFDGTNSAKYSGKITQAMSSNYYTFWLSGSSNAYTNTYKGNFDSLANAIYVYDQTAYIYTSTNGTAASNYSSSGAGGNVTITARYLDESTNSATQTTTPSSDGAASVTYERAVYHTAVTYKASANSGYRFVGWYTSTTATSAASTDATYTRTSSLTGTNTLYARFLRTYTVTIAKSPSTYSGTAPTVNSNTTSATVDAGSSVTLASNAPDGTSAVWRSGSTSGSAVTSPYTPTSDVTLYCCYSLSAPTISSFTYDDSAYIEGGAAITPSKTATSAAGANGSLSYEYTFVSGGTGPSNGYSIDDDDSTSATYGAFSATVAGTYKIRLTVTDSAYGLSSSNTKDYTIAVKPAPVTASDFAYIADKFNSGSGTAAAPWKTPVNRTEFNIRSYIKEESRNSNYTYTFVRSEGSYVYTPGTGAVSRTGGQVSSVTSSSVYEVTDTASASGVIHNTVYSNNDNEGWYYKVSVTKTRNAQTSTAFEYYFYYGVTADFLIVQNFDFSSFNDNVGEEVQKIYDEDNGIDHIDANYDAGGEGTNDFNTVLWFSKNNIDYQTVAVWAKNTFSILTDNYSATPNDAAHNFTGAYATVTQLIRSLPTSTVNNVNLMSTTGPKWFKGYIDDENNPRIAAQTPNIENSLHTIKHTTVGTSSASADRPIYYVDNTGSGPYADTRVMAFYVLDGETDVYYQTAQTPADELAGKYRFYVPADARYIMFAHVADNSYVLPTFDGSNNRFSMSAGSEYLKAWTETIDLTASANVDKNLYRATASSASGGINNYTGSMETLGG